MTSRPPAPPLPKPQHPAVAAKALAEAAYAAAHAWAQPLEPDSHNRAISQLYSTLRDLGIAARGLARYQTAGASPDPASRDFPRHVTASARWLLSACESLDGVLAAEGISSLPDPDEPGAALCRTARNVILAWRQPSGTSADRDTTVRRFITATGFLSSATLGLAVYAPRHRVIDLQVVERQPRRSHRLPDRGHPGTRRRCRARTCQGTGRVPGRRGTAMTGPGNADRAAWAAQAIEAFQSAAGHHGGLGYLRGDREPDHRAVPLRRPARHQLRRRS